MKVVLCIEESLCFESQGGSMKHYQIITIQTSADILEKGFLQSWRRSHVCEISALY